MSVDPLEIVAGLPCWSGPVDPEPLSGGLTNTNFKVRDAGRDFVARIGGDIPVHQIMALFVPVCGIAADRFGLRPVFLAGAIATLVLVGPCWWLMHQTDTVSVFAGQLGLTLSSTAGWALSVTALTLTAPAHLRCSVVALGYNICMRSRRSCASSLKKMARMREIEIIGGLFRLR